MKRGLVLEGGAMRGMFTAGILDVMMENRIVLDGVIGVSAGAAFGCCYKSGQIGRTLRYNLKYCRDKRYCGVRSLLKTGDIYGAEFCYRTLPLELDPFDDAAFEASPMEFFVGATDAETGEAVYFRCEKGGTHLLDRIRASASMPFVSRAVPISGGLYLDGGISDSIPIAFLESMGYDRNIVVLTQPRGFVKPRVRPSPLVRLALRKYPRVAEAMLRRHEFYNETLAYIANAEREGRLLVIAPDRELPIGHISHDPRELQGVYDIGKEMGIRRLSEMREFLKN